MAECPLEPSDDERTEAVGSAVTFPKRKTDVPLPTQQELVELLCADPRLHRAPVDVLKIVGAFGRPRFSGPLEHLGRLSTPHNTGARSLLETQENVFVLSSLFGRLYVFNRNIHVISSQPCPADFGQLAEDGSELFVFDTSSLQMHVYRIVDLAFLRTYTVSNGTVRNVIYFLGVTPNGELVFDVFEFSYKHNVMFCNKTDGHTLRVVSIDCYRHTISMSTAGVLLCRTTDNAFTEYNALDGAPLRTFVLPLPSTTIDSATTLLAPTGELFLWYYDYELRAYCLQVWIATSSTAVCEQRITVPTQGYHTLKWTRRGQLILIDYVGCVFRLTQ